ncbi:MAG: 3-deoxy-manno-octulosonate cytidylyltransferase [Bacteroidetes bacterium RIFOXYA12_FULL_35_11]|nr:MAG: 3-deoxy-manno-octulosonate cytidylyltransferase [Bacteroidetes bacterium GWF2_35_48]OFY73533.1 MAG: 3-deoxy-manno-octulosonate cytidylyltransferase [Bacteroidetes bacterium RIFOXYA12_FULL_35_11]OFY96474.1 MAG: 3-deoxy-manno-octulosonate cytidylyltransferase [Bacteroidetes bacterium RIFOXYB2_FULL_35_7]OFY96706.1 MAG: 3-deoxy-manno-octulosonate cytidylyltransferase [Bacteroidetes bacterium RIFOXYC12_FULL_35_7]HBX51073.1 3-deoxy-manno-octulosonate cytidylyltransferase [Bacteroidales bacter
MNIIGIIPARFASTRFPGKPLADIFGKPMIQHVFEQASKAFDTVYVATDDINIFSAVENFGGKAVMTADTHNSGTDRIAEAIEKIIISENSSFDVIINIQGDEPFIQPEQLLLLQKSFELNTGTQIATLVKPISNLEDLFNTNIPKVTLAKNKTALYFSRSPIPFIRGKENDKWHTAHTFYKHIGIYGYTYDALKKITQLPQSSLEKAESLEQLRWLENGIPIHVEVTDMETLAVDTPEDLEKIIRNYSRQKK